MLAEARSSAERIGMPGLLAKIAAELEAPAPSPAPRATHRHFHLCKEGELWTVTMGDRVARFKDSRGLEWLSLLIEQPGREVHVLSMVGAGGLAFGDSGEALDREAIDSYRARLEDLSESLREAESFGDAARAERARTEIDAIASELLRGVGLGGRSRRSGSAIERARVNVQRRVRDAIRRIAAVIPELGRHLDESVRTGSYCSYRRDR